MAGTSTRERSRAPSFVLEEQLPRPGTNLKRSRNRGSKEQRQWAATVVRQATPKIIESLVEAAESLTEPTQRSQVLPVNAGSGEDEDDSLLALLLRLLRTPDAGAKRGAEGTVARAAASASENPPLG